VADPGVSFIVPVHNGESWLDEVIASILAQRDCRSFEILAIDDASTDRSLEILARHEAGGHVRVLRAPVRGAAAAMNQGIRDARHPVICLVDQDVVLQQGWLAVLLPAVLAPGVGAAQGQFVTDPKAPIVSRVAGMDLEQRYAAMGRGRTNHVCTGNSAYRAAALHEVGLFDETFGYGYDNDMSYRLADAGYELRFCADAKSLHRWRETLGGYLAQQYGQGYGRLDLVAKHPRHVTGDTVSPAPMMLHAPLMLAAILAGATSLASGVAGLPWRPWLWLGGLTVCGLGAERLVAGARAAVRHRDPAGLLFVPLHLLRDVAWSSAVVMWTVRRLLGRGRRPWHSMGTK
jgi:GT2 family glycosyltransferase